MASWAHDDRTPRGSWKATVGAMLIVVLLFTLGGLMSRTTTTTTRCYEDQPCWDALTMGNHVGDFDRYMREAAMPSFMDYVWWHDGDCFAC